MEGFLNPNEVLKQLDLKEDMIAADFGSGSGSWAIPLAKILKKGKVYAIDIQEEPLSALKSRARLEKLSNIEVKKTDLGREGGSGLAPNSVDIILMINLLFQLENKREIFDEAQVVLKKGGKVLVAEWEKDAPTGPENRVTIEEIKSIAQELNFRIKKELEAGIYHWGLILEKS